MKTFQCTKCGCSLMQPTEPFRCPQCGSQGIGLFRAIGEAGNTGYGMNQGFRSQQPGTFQPQNSGFGASQGAFQPNVYGQSGGSYEKVGVGGAYRCGKYTSHYKSRKNEGEILGRHNDKNVFRTALGCKSRIDGKEGSSDNTYHNCGGKRDNAP